MGATYETDLSAGRGQVEDRFQAYLNGGSPHSITVGYYYDDDNITLHETLGEMIVGSDRPFHEVSIGGDVSNEMMLLKANLVQDGGPYTKDEAIAMLTAYINRVKYRNYDSTIWRDYPSY